MAGPSSQIVPSISWCRVSGFQALQADLTHQRRSAKSQAQQPLSCNIALLLFANNASAFLLAMLWFRNNDFCSALVLSLYYCFAMTFRHCFVIMPLRCLQQCSGVVCNNAVACFCNNSVACFCNNSVALFCNNAVALFSINAVVLYCNNAVVFFCNNNMALNCFIASFCIATFPFILAFTAIFGHCFIIKFSNIAVSL